MPAVDYLTDKEIANIYLLCPVAGNKGKPVLSKNVAVVRQKLKIIFRHE
jgi:hypothetical protein